MVSTEKKIPLGEEVKTVPELIKKRLQISPELQSLFTKEQGQWSGLSWLEFDKLVAEMALYLEGVDCHHGNRIAIIASTGLVWDICHYAILQLGAVVVGIDPHDTEINIKHILDKADISGILLDDEGHKEKISNDQSTLSFVLTVGYDKDISLDIKGDGTATANNNFGTAIQSEVRPDDPATIIFTSGTTGTPQGIPYTHGQIIQACQAILGRYDDVTSAAHLACWLPLSNLFQRMLNFCGIAVGAKIFYVSDPREIAKQLPEINPDILIGVPRFYEKIYEGITQKIDQQSWPVKKLFNFCLGLHLKLGEKQHTGTSAKSGKGIIDKLLLGKIRTLIFGNRLKYVISGSAPMPLWLLKWYDALGILVLEAYGISENIIPIACNTRTEYKFGTVGGIIAPNRVRLAEDGELQVKGPGVFKEYLSGSANDKLTADGYLRTGDEATIDKNGYVTLLGRKSDFFKTSTGKRISPLKIESDLQQIAFLEQVLVIGEGRKIPIILATVPKEQLNLTQRKPADPEIEQIKKEINVTVKGLLPAGLHLAAAILINRQFSIAGGELTANLKLRRKIVIKKYQQQVEKTYEQIAQQQLDQSQIISLEEIEGILIAL